MSVHLDGRIEERQSSSRLAAGVSTVHSVVQEVLLGRARKQDILVRRDVAHETANRAHK